MKRILADNTRFVVLEGVGPVSRPVDIDQSQTGFHELRTLRIYRFATGSVIDGHAEEDEVLILVLAGSIELTMSYGDDPGLPQTLTVAGESPTPCAAYLPPHAAYRLVPHTPADIAYIRARPKSARPPKVFAPACVVQPHGVRVLFEENAYAEKLRIRVMQIDRFESELALLNETESDAESLIHVRNLPEDAQATISSPVSDEVPLKSWDTLAVTPGERPTLQLAPAHALVMTVLAI